MYLLELLKAINGLLPPPGQCHHVMRFARYGCEAEGWKERLAMDLRVGDGWRTVFFDDDDFKQAPAELAVAVVRCALLAA